MSNYDKTARSLSILMFMLGVWFCLAFVGGIDYLVTPWRIKHGFWFWLSLVLMLNIFAAAIVCWRKINWCHYFVISLTGSWLVIQFIAHWKFMIWPPGNPSKIASYYSHYKTWYLIPQMHDRVVPDGYHVILTVLLCVCFYLGVRLLFKSNEKKPQHLNTESQTQEL